ncbi:MAG: tetratricopeptide repeat protein [Candidatus Latescibacterota bacterium]
MSLFLLCSGPVFASDPTETIDTAVLALQTGKPDSAAALLYDVVDGVVNRQEQVRAMFYLAQALGKLGRTDEKIQYLTRAAEIDSSAAYADDVQLAYAETLLEAGNINGSISITQQFLQSYPGSPLMPEMLYLVGNAHLAGSEWLKAFNAFSEIIKSYPDTPAAREAVLKEGVCLYRLQLISGAIDRLEKYLGDAHKGTAGDEALYYLGLSYEDAGRFEHAARSFRKLVLNYPSYSGIIDAYYRLGKSLFEAGMFDESENAFHNYIENAPKTAISHDQALFYLERISFHKGRYSSENEIAENFVSKYPASRLAPKLLLDLARLYRLSDEPERANEKYETILSRHARSEYADSALFYHADTYVAMNRPDQAVAFLSEHAHMRRNPVRAQASYLKLGMLGEEMQLPDAAMAWYDSAVTVGASPNLTVRALLGVARCYHDVNRWLDASRTYERILRVYPNTPHRADAHYSLAGVYYLMGRVTDAVQTAKEGIRFAKGKRKTDLLVFLADVYEYQDVDQSIRYYQDIWSDIGNSMETRAEALLKIGDISMRKGDRKSAAEAYARIVNGATNSPYREKALKKLGEISGSADTPETSKPQ